MLNHRLITPVLEKNSFECHTESKNIFQLSKCFYYQYESTNLSSEMIQYLQILDPVHAIKISPKKYQFFSGWHWLSACRRENIKKINVIIYSKITPTEINLISSVYILKNQFGAFHRKSCLADMIEYLDSLPGQIRAELLSNSKSISPQVLVEMLANESRSAIRNQQKHKKIPIISEVSICDLLIGGAN